LIASQTSRPSLVPILGLQHLEEPFTDCPYSLDDFLGLSETDLGISLDSVVIEYSVTIYEMTVRISRKPNGYLLRIPLEQPIFVPQSFIDSTIELFGPGERFSATFEGYSNPTSNLERVVAGTEFNITQDPEGAAVINAEIPELDMKTMQFVLMDGLNIDADRLDNQIEESSCEEDDGHSQEDGYASDSIVVNSSSANNGNTNVNWGAGGNDDNTGSWADKFENAHENDNYQNNVGDWANDGMGGSSEAVLNNSGNWSNRNWGIGNWETVGVGGSSKDAAFNKGLGNTDEHTLDEDLVQEQAGAKQQSVEGEVEN
jgi:hypothetical protein